MTRSAKIEKAVPCPQSPRTTSRPQATYAHRIEPGAPQRRRRRCQQGPTSTWLPAAPRSGEALRASPASTSACPPTVTTSSIPLRPPPRLPSVSDSHHLRQSRLGPKHPKLPDLRPPSPPPPSPPPPSPPRLAHRNSGTAPAAQVPEPAIAAVERPSGRGRDAGTPTISGGRAGPSGSVTVRCPQDPARRKAANLSRRARGAPAPCGRVRPLCAPTGGPGAGARAQRRGKLLHRLH